MEAVQNKGYLKILLGTSVKKCKKFKFFLDSQEGLNFNREATTITTDYNPDGFTNG